ncbi:hypothetical protein [Streptomyces mirabilis]|uniref:hypothetical protein n=1 Tax=Streptomyces mirabilis TaxID=68239 RepID=UPI0036DEE855
MTEQDKILIGVATVTAAASAALVIWPPKGWARGDAAGVAQAVTAIIAVAVALLIATQDRRRSDQAAADVAAEERRAFARRRDYDECVRLLQLVEEDRRNNTKSVEAKALVLAMWPRRNWMGRAVDYYVESERDPARPDEPQVAMRRQRRPPGPHAHLADDVLRAQREPFLGRIGDDGEALHHTGRDRLDPVGPRLLQGGEVLLRRLELRRDGVPLGCGAPCPRASRTPPGARSSSRATSPTGWRRPSTP